MAKPNLTGKVAPSHSTVTDTAALVANQAHKIIEISKISFGEIRHVRGGRRDIKFSPINGGIKAKVRGSGAIQELYIYTDEPSKVEQLLRDSFIK